MEVVLCDVGIKVESNSDDLCFTFEKNYYLPTVDDFTRLKLLYDITKVGGFSLKVRTNHNDRKTKYLSLFLNVEKQNPENSLREKNRVIQFIYDSEYPTNDETMHHNDIECDPEILTVPAFYNKLREYHLNDELDSEIDHSILERFLKPTLRPYQLNAIKWMYDREKVARYIEADDIKLVNKFIPDQILYADPRNLMLKWEKKKVLLPSGGILADEMGLGKTVEVLALILLNIKKKRKIQEILLDHDYTDLCKNSVPKMKCICSKPPQDKQLITCSKCQLDQHKDCVLKHSIGIPKIYLCPPCWRHEEVLESNTTLIVSPASIKLQWKSEIDRHINKSDFKVLIYNGVHETGWISPQDLLNYDVVLTDYNVLTKEIYYTNGENKRVLRYEKKHLSPISPLPHVKWFRVVLDEAQMVEGITRNVTQMVKMLPAVHRWAVTGTPIEKNIGNLFGLVHFLDYKPYNHAGEWNKKLLKCFNEGFWSPLVTAMGRIMWRTCKSAVVEQLAIPPQKEIIHFVQMSDIQKVFYNQEHQKCTAAFAEKVQKLQSVEKLRQLDSRTIKSVMEPLRKLRLDCTNPGVIGKYMQNLSRKLLSPDELQKHLISNTEIECKSQLRNIASSLNGLAGLQIIKDEIEAAIKSYKQVLNLAEIYKEGTICVDSLLQIHALSSLIDILPSSKEEKNVDKLIVQYKEKMAELEWKYIQNYYNKVKDIELKLEEKTQLINLNYDKYKEGNWWRSVIDRVNDESEFIYRLYSELRDSDSIDLQSFKSIRSLDLYLIMWWDKVWANRKKLTAEFDKISFFAIDLKSQHAMPAERIEKINNLVREAFECHLNKEFLNEEQIKLLQKKNDGTQKTCQICKIQRVLNLYECTIFKKTLVESDENNRTEGSWGLVGQEIVLRYIESYSRKEKFNQKSVEEGAKLIEMLETIKNEFKELSQYFVEINYTVSAFDELNMCKIRLQKITPDEWKELSIRSKNHILDIEVQGNFHEMIEQKKSGEMEFARLQGTLKYLQHLSDKKTVDICPVCQQLPEEKYTVLQCGHHLCVFCFIQMRKTEGMLTCPCCRSCQKFKNVHIVSMTAVKEQTDVFVEGSHSTKVFKIIQTILKLKQQDETVKILIFSHWVDILNVIARALDQNYIGHRTNNAKFVQNVQEFKKATSNITCFLLPLKFGSKGLNMIEATHVFLVEPILNPDEEMQAVGRVHRIGQTKETFVHRFIVEETIEENIHLAIQQGDREKWTPTNATLANIWELFHLRDRQQNLLSL